MNAKAALKEIRDEYWSVDNAGENEYAEVAAALGSKPSDPLVLWKCIKVLHHYSMPVAEGYSADGPPNAKGRTLLKVAIACADKALAKAKLKSRDERVLFFWTRMIQALYLVLEKPTPAQLAECEKLCDAVYDRILETKSVGDEEEHLDNQYRLMVLARRRAWELAFAGPPFGGESWERIAAYTTDWDWCLGWPLRPLFTAPAWLEYATTAIREKPRGDGPVVWLDQAVVQRDEPSKEELRGRMLYLALKGLKQPAVDEMGKQVIDDKLPTVCLEVMLEAGFDPNPLLAHAVENHDAKAIRALVAAGADPDKGGAKSPRKLAAKSKRRATIEALEGGASKKSAGESPLAPKLKTAAKAIPKPWLRLFTSMYGQDKLDLAALVDRALSGSPDTVDELLADLEGSPFDKLVIATLVARAGLGKAEKRKGPLVLAKTGDVVVCGDLEVDGPIIDSQAEGALIVAGSLKAHALVTEADCLIGGNATVRDFVWGDYNDCSLVVGGDLKSPIVVMTDHSCETLGEIDAKTHLEDPDDDDLRKVFAATMFKGDSLDRKRVSTALAKGTPVLAKKQ